MNGLPPTRRLSRRRLLRGLGAGLAAGMGAGLALGSRALPLHAAGDGEDGATARSLRAVKPLEVTARPIAYFDSNRPDVKTFGTLSYRGGVSLYSNFEDFGGLSGLVMEPDGSGLLAITDVGNWLSADITYDGDRPSGLTRAVMGPLRGTDGRALEGKLEQDAESVTLLTGTLGQGVALVGFERHHRILRYPVSGRQLGAAAGELKLPVDARRMPKNQGFEAVAVLKGGPHAGSVIAFAERFTRGSGYHTGWIWLGDEPQKLQLKDIDGFDITDATGLDNGDLLVLERRFRWTEGVQMRLRRLMGAEIVPGARMTGQTLLQVNGDFQIDNMEGVGLHRDGEGRQVVTLISDDNFNHFLQRTLLLQFTLADGRNSATRT